MACWMMKLHPNNSNFSNEYIFKALSKRIIGVDFAPDHVTGSLKDISDESLDKLSSDDRTRLNKFYNQMQIDDYVLLVSHFKPNSLVKIISDYGYLKYPEKMGVWFRHFRLIEIITFTENDQTQMPPGTMMELVSPDTPTYQVIEDLLKKEPYDEWA